MRDVFIKGIDREFRYEFGADLDVLCAVINYPARNRSDCYIVYEKELSGEALIAFIKEYAPSAEHIISDIVPEGCYELVGFDD